MERAWATVSLGAGLPNIPFRLGLHLWPAGQDPGHAEAEHTPEEVGVPDPGEQWLLQDNRCPPDLVATAITGDPAARPGAVSRVPRTPGLGVSFFPCPSVFHFWGFFIVIKLM